MLFGMSGQVTLFSDRLKNRFDSQIEQCMENSTTQPDNEKDYGFHNFLLAPESGQAWHLPKLLENQVTSTLAGAKETVNGSPGLGMTIFTSRCIGGYRLDDLITERHLL